MAPVSAIARLQTGRGTQPWRGAVCLLLAVFFLYNPFCTICMSSGPSAVVHHPVSYRSTIASSELGCGTVQHTKLHVVSLAVLVTALKIPLQDKADIRPKPVDATATAVIQAFAESLWFRPPPVR
jgi:hypothetical protein